MRRLLLYVRQKQKVYFLPGFLYNNLTKHYGSKTSKCFGEHCIIALGDYSRLALMV